MVKRKKVKIKSHGTAYYIVRSSLHGCPILKSGRIEKSTCSLIEEAPKRFRNGHISALKKLGISNGKIKGYLKKIEYY